MSLRIKLLLGFLALTLPVLLLGGSALYFLSNTQHALDEFNEDTVSKMYEFSFFKDGIHMAVIGAYEYVQTGNMDAKMRTSMMLEQASAAQERFATVAHHSAEESAHAEQIQMVLMHLRTNINELITAYESGTRDEELLPFIVSVREAQMHAMMTAHSDIDVFLTEERARAIAASERAFATSVQVFIALLVTFVILGVLFALVFSHRIASAIRDVSAVALAISRGNFDVSLTPRSNDEVGKLMRAINTMRIGLRGIIDAKNDFISTVSHQLRTPLTIIRGNVEVLEKELDGPLSPEQKKTVKDLRHGVDRMIATTATILNMAKVEAQAISQEGSRFDLAALLADVVDEMHAKAQQAGVELTYAAHATPAYVHADPARMQEAFQNLIDNGIIYSSQAKQQGEVTVTLAAGDQGFVIDVADNGMGIPKKDQKKIFTRFFRAENAKRITNDGSGLGLAITKLIIEQSGGTIDFVSKAKAGTTFTVHVPAAE